MGALGLHLQRLAKQQVDKRDGLPKFSTTLSGAENCSSHSSECKASSPTKHGKFVTSGK